MYFKYYMISDELFSFAGDLKSQAVECERTRAYVDRVWRGLDHVLDGPVAEHLPALWQSAAADASRLRLRHQHNQLILLRYEIEQVARRLQARADDLYANAARVEQAAQAARREEAREREQPASYSDRHLFSTPIDFYILH